MNCEELDKRTKAYKECVEQLAEARNEAVENDTFEEFKEKLEQDIDNNEAFVEKGLGDKVEQITEKTGIKKLVEWVAGEDCGCNERKQKLNKAIRLRFPVVRCFTEEQYNTWREFRKEHYNEKANEFVRINRGIQQGILQPIYAQLFARKLPMLSCCTNQYFKEIDQVYLKYKE